MYIRAMSVKFPLFKDCIILEDEHFIFINKPSGISSLDERSGEANSIIKMAKKYHADAQLCHRIDKETSGLLLIAKHNEAYKEMAVMFEHRKVFKEYHAIVQGNLQVNEKSILLPLSISAKGIAKVDMKDGRKAETIVTTIKAMHQYSLISCIPVTGRLHQIRIHLASQHFPLVADTTYGGSYPYLSKLKKNYKTSKWENEKPILQRVALHAYRLKFEVLGKAYQVEAPYPKDLDVFIKLIEKNQAN